MRHYYILCPDDDEQEFIALFQELYPKSKVYFTNAVLTPIDDDTNSVTINLKIIVYEKQD